MRAVSRRAADRQVPIQVRRRIQRQQPGRIRPRSDHRRAAGGSRLRDRAVGQVASRCRLEDSRPRLQARVRSKRRTPVCGQHHTRRRGPTDAVAAARVVSHRCVQRSGRLADSSLPGPPVLPVHRLSRPARAARRPAEVFAPLSRRNAAAATAGIGDALGGRRRRRPGHPHAGRDETDAEDTDLLYRRQRRPVEDPQARRPRRRPGLGRVTERSAQRREGHAGRRRHARAVRRQLAGNDSRRAGVPAPGQFLGCRRDRGRAGRRRNTNR